MKKILTVTLGAAATLALAAGPAAAHPHSKAANGSIGPAVDGPGGGAHNGIECAVKFNPNLEVSLAAPPPNGLGLECPAPSDRGNR